MAKNKQLNTIIKTLRATYPSEKLDDIKRAYEFAESALGDLKRVSGQKQIDHALNVAESLAEKKLSQDIVIAGLLHDILEYTKFTREDIEKKFGQKVARLIIGENRLDSLKYIGKERYAENLRRMFLAMADDVQIIFIKFADRIDNLKSLEYLPPAKRDRMAMESLYIYAPIANRLGMDIVRRELEDLSFKYLMPKEFKKIEKLVRKYYKSGAECFSMIKQALNQEMKEAGINIISLENRIKNLYSLYMKSQEQQRDPQKIYDVAACRLIVPDIPSCYTALGLIHRLWHPLPGRFKDYISQPKPNGYRALHTNIFCERHVIEVQIRTPEMHEEAEYGIAAHWIYKEKRNQWRQNIVRHTAWLKDLTEVQKEIKNNLNLSNTLKSIKLDFFHNHIFVLTPKGDVIDLPDNATPLDFAYAIHADLGHHYHKAKINGKPISITRQLKSNEMVEIIPDFKKANVHKSWLKIAKTRRALHEIKSYLAKHQ